MDERDWLTQIPASVMERMCETGHQCLSAAHTVQLCVERKLGSNVEKTALWAAASGKDSVAFVC